MPSLHGPTGQTNKSFYTAEIVRFFFVWLVFWILNILSCLPADRLFCSNSRTPKWTTSFLLICLVLFFPRSYQFHPALFMRLFHLGLEWFLYHFFALFWLLLCSSCFIVSLLAVDWSFRVLVGIPFFSSTFITGIVQSCFVRVEIGTEKPVTNGL